MAFELLPGDECIIHTDCRVDGVLAFRKGDVVEIKGVNPDPQAPGLKYVVYSELLGMEVRIAGSNIERINCRECGSRIPEGEMRCVQCGWINPERESELIREDMQKLQDRIFWRQRAARRGY